MDRTLDIRSAACTSGEGLVGYLYGEGDADERSRFETHLAGCDACTAEFAELSFARLDVYEWKRDEFAGMETPRITVPYKESASVSVFGAIRGWFAFPAQLAAAGGFAVLAVIAGVWFMNPPAQERAGVGPASTPAPVNERSFVKPAASTEPPASDRSDDAESAVRNPAVQVPVKAKTKPVQVKTAERPVQPAKTANTSPRTTPVRRNAAPRLNDFEDEDDNTLRLGDLLAEIDTKE
jgi:anti-sigma factor RsiW